MNQKRIFRTCEIKYVNDEHMLNESKFNNKYELIFIKRIIEILDISISKIYAG